MLVPSAIVLADHGEADDLIVVGKARSSTTEDDTLLVNAINNMYIFDIELYEGDGSPLDVTQWGAVAGSIDPNGNTVDPGACGGEPYDSACIYTTTETTEATNEITLRIPASVIGWGQSIPANGVAIGINVHADGDGEPITDNGSPSDLAYINLVVNQAANNGNWDEAAEASQSFTPVFLLDAQPKGVIDAGNPLINPGFELGAEANTDNPGPWESATPPWALYRGDDSGTPAASSTEQISGQVSGDAVRVVYDMEDQGTHAALAQFLHAPGADAGHWFSTDELTVEYDIRVTGDITSGGTATNFHGSANVHWLSDSGSVGVNMAPAGGIPADGEWRHVELDFSQDVPVGEELTFFTLSLYSQGYDTASEFVVDYDNVQIKGAHYVNDVNPRNDLTDGYSVFIDPVEASVTDTDEVVQDLTTLADGTAVYLYEITGKDYTDINPRELALSELGNLAVQVFDHEYPATGVNRSNAAYTQQTSASAVGDNVFQVLDHEGEVSPGILVAIPADQIVSDTDVVVPWFWGDIETDDTYTDTFGFQAEPASGYHSLARNQLSGLSIADQLDYGFTPIQLSGQAAHTVGTPTDVTFFCKASASETVCPVPEDGQVNFTFSATNQDTDVLETLDVSLVTEDGTVLDTATVDVPGQTISTLSIPDATGMHNERVHLELGAGAFAEGAESQEIRLAEDIQENQAPVVDLTGDVDAVAEPGEIVTVEATATDVEGDPITFSHSLSTGVPGDTFTDNGDGTATWTWEIPLSQKTGTDITFIASDGDLTGQDTTSIELEIPAKAQVINPLNETGVATTSPLEDTEVTLRASASDLSGSLELVEIYPDGFDNPGVDVTSQGGEIYTLAHTYAEPGEYTVGVTVKNSDRIWTNDTATIQVAENQAPTVDAGDDIALDATDPAPTSIELDGSVADPEKRGIDQASLAWTDASGAEIATGTETTTVDLGPGSYEFTLTANDADGLTSSDSVTVIIDDSIQAEAKLLSVGQPDQEGRYAIDGPTDMALGSIRGQVSVVDDLGDEIEGAQVNGTVLYHGIGGTELGFQTHAFDASTRADGTADFTVEHDIPGTLSLPGLHEIQIVVTNDSRAGAPVDDTETDTLSIFYWVGPQV